MDLIAVSLNYKKVALAERGRLTVPKDQLVNVDQALHDEKSLLENIILATCNRTDVYAVVDQLHTGRYYIRRFLARYWHVTIAQLDEWVTVYEGDAAIDYLLHVTSGLAAQILGEPQVLGQFKTAFFTAQASGTTGALLNQLGTMAIAFAKRMHTRYRIAELAQSAGQAGLHQIKQQLAPLADKTLLVVGMGDFGQHVLQNAVSMGFDQIWVTNRHQLRAESVAAKYPNVTVVPWEKLNAAVTQVEAVILATSAQTPVLALQAAGSLQTVIDLGVPQNVASVPEGVSYADMDTLTTIVSANAQRRRFLCRQIETEIPAAVAAYRRWERELHVVPVIRELRQEALAVEEQVYTSLLNKLPPLDDRQQKIVAKHLKSIVNQLLKQPIQTIKEASVQPEANYDLALFKQLFGLEETEVQAFARNY
ncbi:glutamyl-tRNA reductase [Lacticaseibacillus sp. GG6-2]